MLADTHCHLNLNAFDEDLMETIDRARAAGVTRILVPGTDLETSRQAVALAQKFADQGVFAAVGVHPNDATQWTDDTIIQLGELARSSRVVAIGEIGLDYYRDYAAPDLQMQVFREQLALAASLALPVIIHNRQAFDDLWPVLEQWSGELRRMQSPLADRPGVLHSFDGNAQTAAVVREKYFFIGVTGPVTYRNAADRQATLAQIPMEQLLLETDAPFLTPMPFRGRRNEPAYIPFIVEKLAGLHQISAAQVAAITTLNANRLFRWSNIP